MDCILAIMLFIAFIKPLPGFGVSCAVGVCAVAELLVDVDVSVFAVVFSELLLHAAVKRMIVTEKNRYDFIVLDFNDEKDGYRLLAFNQSANSWISIVWVFTMFVAMAFNSMLLPWCR